MTEEEAYGRVASSVSRETLARLEIYREALLAENANQNLISSSTTDTIWSRHILDCLQLLPLAPADGLWVDLGSGAGLPGLVIAAASSHQVALIEPRAKRCAFLSDASEKMGMSDRVTIVRSRAETAPAMKAAVVSARAVASLPTLFAMGAAFTSPATRWLLMKGRNAAEEVDAATASWHAAIQPVASITDSEASILVASDVRPKGKRA